ncbi:MAG: hypothetical protein JW900_00950 [Anaerolineae bacterium]|nr:hypothetical protein [Anaerolineae bacterium]
MSQRQMLALILGAYLLLGVIYSLATPPLEASDEFKHYPYTQYVQTHRDLPVLDPEICTWPGPETCPWLQDGGQPPAYYILMATLTSWIDTSDVHQVREMNRHAYVGDPSQVCNKNLVIHYPEQERFPWRGSVLAIHLIRFLTIGFGAGTVILTYLTAREMFPGRADLALGGAALTAFTPMFLFVNSAANNDALAATIGCFTLLLSIRLVRDGLRGPIPLWRYGLLGAVVGLFLLSKLSGLASLILLALLLAWVSFCRRSLRPLLVGLPIVVGIAVLIAGWWFLRNWQLYGDPTALNVFVAIQGVRPSSPTLRDWWQEFGTFRWTYWGLFGAVNVMAPRWVYTFFDLLSLAGVTGFVAWAVRQVKAQAAGRGLLAAWRNASWWIPLLWLAILFASVIRWTVIYFSFQGRLVFPAIAGISPLLLLGLQQWVPDRYRKGLTGAVSLALFAIAATLPFTTILPAYEMPQPLALEDVPLQARVEPVDVGGGVRLVGWELDPQAVQAGESVELVVYWESVAPEDGNVVSFARLLGRGHELAGDVNRHPACGMVPTVLWQPGQVWRDPYRVPVRPGAAAPTLLRVEVGLYDPQAGQELGRACVGEAKLVPPAQPDDVPYPLEVALGDGITLRGYGLAPQAAAPGATVMLTLYWAARATPSTSYQALVHLLDSRGELVAQADGPPLEGDYPTRAWSAGELITDPHAILLPADLPAGEYRLQVGMYNLANMTRLPRLDGAGDTIELPTTLEIAH